METSLLTDHGLLSAAKIIVKCTMILAVLLHLFALLWGRYKNDIFFKKHDIIVQSYGYNTAIAVYSFFYGLLLYTTIPQLDEPVGFIALLTMALCIPLIKTIIKYIKHILVSRD